MKKLFTLFALFLLSLNILFAQQLYPSLEDSLALLNKREKVNFLLKYLDKYFSTQKIFSKQILQPLDSAIAWAEQINDQKLLARTYHQAAITYYYLLDYNKAIIFAQKALLLYRLLHDTIHMIRIIHRKASCYFYRGDYWLSILENQKSLKLSQKVNYHIGLIVNNRELGYKYLRLKQFDSAQKYLSIALKYTMQFGNNANKGYTLSELANFYLTIKKPQIAKKYILNALYYAQKTSRSHLLSLLNSRAALTYFYLNNLDSAKYYINYALNINDPKLKAYACKIASAIYFKQKNYPLAIKYLDTAIYLNKQIRNYHHIISNYDSLYNIYLSNNQIINALLCRDTQVHYQDSIFNKYLSLQTGNIAAANEISKFENKLSTIRQKQIKNKKHLRILLFTLLMLGIFTAVIVTFSMQQQKYLQHLKQKNQIISEQKAEILQQAAKLNKQKQFLENINRQIESSLQCALMIQKTTLPNLNELKKTFSDFYLIYKPLQIVSGDFYWTTKTPDNTFYIVLADGTGHGVPGAFISLITERMLDEIILLQKQTQPNKILFYLNNEFKKLINKTDESLLAIGVELILLKIQPIGNNFQVTYSSAHMPFAYYIPGQKLTFVRSDNRGIGGFFYKSNATFEQHQLTCPKGTIFYLFSDGYRDQICSDTQKRISTKRFIALIDQIKDSPVKDQGRYLEIFLEKCLRGVGQRDDISVLILKL